MSPVTNGESTVESKETNNDSTSRTPKKKSSFLSRRDSSVSLGPWSKSDAFNGDKALATTPESTKNVVELLLEGDPSRLQQIYPAFQTTSAGDKNQGFDVLYHNMKHGQTSVKSLQDFIRESISTEDLRAKHLTKLAKQAAGSSPLGSFAPMFEVFKVMAEKLSSCHMDVVQKLQEIVKELLKYLDEQKGKHKQVKDELSGTANALHQVESTAGAVQKSKEKYYQLCMDAERLKKAGGSNKEIEKAEVKSKKASEEYRNLVEKYATVRNDYEQKMTESAKRFQEIEVFHLKHMKKILDSYIGAYENANVLARQVHQEFRRQVDENTIGSLIKNYSESKGTGTEKPSAIVFEECDVGSMLLSAEQAPNNAVNGEEPAPAPAPNKSRRPLNLPFRRKKARRPKDPVNGTKDSGKETESIESPEKDNEPAPKVDEEGYTIRPETPKGSHSSWGYGSSDDSDSDADDYTHRKIHVKIKPKDEIAPTAKDSNLDTLNAITRNLTLSSPTPVGGKKLTPSSSTSAIKTLAIDPPAKQEKSTADELMDFFGNSSGSSAPTPANSDPNSFLDLLKTPPVSSSGNTAKKLPSSSSDAALNLFSTSSEKNRGDTKDVKSKPFQLDPPISSSKSTPTNRPSHLTLNSSAPDLQKVAPLASAESWSSLSSVGGTPVESFATSRGPSPLTLSHGDPVPIAVSLAEIVNAFFKVADGDGKCVVKITGEVQISFPAGIVRAFMGNKNPATLSFVMKGCSESVNFKPKHSFLHTDTSQTVTSERSYWFEMTSLTNHIKKITDANPNAPFYNISVLSYEFLSQCGKNLVPLHLSSSWKCEANSTDVTINYNLNKATGSSLKAVQVILPIDGGVTDHKSTPTANWNSNQNRLYWNVSSPITKSAPSGTLTSQLTLASGPSKTKSFAVNFKSEGATLTGSDFELAGSGYRLSLVKKTFVSGKYLLDAN